MNSTDTLLLLIAPICFPLLISIISSVFWKKYKIQQILGIIGAFVLLLIGVSLVNEVLNKGIISFQAGNWIAPFGITIIADTFSAVMVTINGIMAFAVAVYSLNSVNLKSMDNSTISKRLQFGYYPLLNIMYMGINGAFLTGDIFNMYVWYEVILISSFMLLAIGGTKLQLEATFKYVTINLISSAFFLFGVGFLYSLTGTLNMADLAVKVKEVENQNLVTLVSVFFLICFGIKAAVFPLFFAVPTSYHIPPISISAIFAGMLTKVGVYSLFRVFTLIFIGNTQMTHYIILIIAGFTMLVGVLGAASHYDMRRILSFHIISQIGYIILGLALYTPFAIAGAVFYIAHYTIVKANLFLVSGVADRLRGNYDIRKLGGMLNSFPFLAVLFLILALSLAGIPPFSGFWAKFLVIKAGLDVKEYFIVFVCLLVGLLTLFSMMKIWLEAFWKEMPEKIEIKQSKGLFHKSNVSMLLAIMFLATITLSIGFYPEQLFRISNQVSFELMNPDIYINAVLGGIK